MAVSSTYVLVELDSEGHTVCRPISVDAAIVYMQPEMGVYKRFAEVAHRVEESAKTIEAKRALLRLAFPLKVIT